MRISGVLGWVPAAVGGFALGLAGFSLLGGEDGDAESPAEPDVAEVQAQPSDFAREALPGRLLDTYREIGDELGLDWSVIAADGQIEGTPASTPEG